MNTFIHGQAYLHPTTNPSGPGVLICPWTTPTQWDPPVRTLNQAVSGLVYSFS
jgi:hypothetical protein